MWNESNSIEWLTESHKRLFDYLLCTSFTSHFKSKFIAFQLDHICTLKISSYIHFIIPFFYTFSLFINNFLMCVTQIRNLKIFEYACIHNNPQPVYLCWNLNFLLSIKPSSSLLWWGFSRFLQQQQRFFIRIYVSSASCTLAILLLMHYAASKIKLKSYGQGKELIVIVVFINVLQPYFS